MSNRPVSWVKLEEDAYYAVLRALAVNELNWEKEKLLTDLRTILHITNDQHFSFLEEVMGDKLVTRLRNSTANADQAAGQAAANAMPPPPPRQQTPATGGNNARKTTRPTSAGAKFPPGHSPAPQRPHRLSESAVGGDRRSKAGKGSAGLDLKRNSSGAKGGRGLHSQRSRGRGRRISALPKEAAVVQVPQQPRAPRKMLSQSDIKKVMESGSEKEVRAVIQDLEAQDNTIEHHIQIIDQLEDDSLADRDPAKFCQLAIEELELAHQMYEAEEKMLGSSDDDVA